MKPLQKSNKLNFNYLALSCRLMFVTFIFLFSSLISSYAQSKYENRKISDLQITFEGADKDISAAEQFRLILKPVVGDKFSTVKNREALQTLYSTDKIVSAKIEVVDNKQDSLALRFIIRRKTNAASVNIIIGQALGEPITEAELLLKLNILNAGSFVTDQILKNNADSIQSYLRERGYYNAEVDFKQEIIGNDTRVAVTFNVIPNTQSKVENFNINIKDFDIKTLPKPLKLQKGSYFSDKTLDEDVLKIRNSIVKLENLAPIIDSPKVVFDSETNTINIDLNGKIGPKVTVLIDAADEKIGKKDQVKLLPIKREGTIDISAITEGARRLRNKFQEKGYFFADVIPVCSVNPEFPKDESYPLSNGTFDLCSQLSSLDLNEKAVEIKYQAELNRRLKLAALRIEGTDKLTIQEIAAVLDTQAANSFGIIPQFGYGRGYTSTEILEDDRITILSLMRELGYRNATVKVKQGVSPEGEKLIITFVVKEGLPTRINTVEIVGNKEFLTPVLEKELPNLIGKNYSRARARNGVEKLRSFYAKEGFYYANITVSTVELGIDAESGEDRLKIVYNVEKEGKKVFVNRILLNGNTRTKESAIRKAISLRQDEVLQNSDITKSEQVLYGTDAFKRIEIKPEPAGETPKGDQQVDIIVNLEEEKPRIISYGGGYSTDLGWSGFFDIRHQNLFNKLQQGGARVRWSSRQQLVQFDFINPFFLKDGKNRFAPLSITVQYQRDTTVTRFFRSTIDKGLFGIVQRIDANGQPIDEFGATISDPTINRFSITAETQRTINLKSRSLLFARYRYEDVRLFNIDSLLIKDILRPDAKVRISGFGATFVRDTRENCSRKYTVLELIARGEIVDPCRYNASDPTRGNYLTLEYNTSFEQLGGNISFQKLQANYQGYYKLGSTIFAARGVLGMAKVWGKRTRLTGTSFDTVLNGTLPISERFFGGGSTSIRGFEFEQAGPRFVVVPTGEFRDRDNNPVYLNPFTVPIGGNALAIVNLEARIPVSRLFQAVPFYDGGNVFRRVGDIFKPPASSTDLEKNLRALWTHTLGFGLRIKTPFGGNFAVDYGYLLKPPEFLIPQNPTGNAIYRLRQGQLHFRFTQAF